MRLHSFHFKEEINNRLTISLPLPVEVWQPARQGEAYVIPLAEHTGSQCLTEQEHPMLHCDSKVWWLYDTWGALVSEEHKRASVEGKRFGCERALPSFLLTPGMWQWGRPLLRCRSVWRPERTAGRKRPMRPPWTPWQLQWRPTWSVSGWNPR